MILFKTLLTKYSVAKPNGDIIPDITRGSIDAAVLGKLGSTIRLVVDSFTVMRPDLIAHTVYGDQGMADLVLKYNGISNPFSLYEGQVIFLPDSRELNKTLKTPKEILDISNIEIDEVESIFINPKTPQDEKRLELLKKQNKGNEVLPSNVNKKGNKNIKIKDGKIVFGEDVTTVNKNNCPEPISRANLKTALIKNNLFG
jgi:hypothetical protein